MVLSKSVGWFTQRLWAKVVMRKWLNISARDLEYGADTEDESENEDVVEENQDSSSDEGSCFFYLSLSLSRIIHQFFFSDNLSRLNRFNR